MSNILKISKLLLSRIKTLHSYKILHRDIKPSNIMTSTKSKFNIFLIDYGLAKKYVTKKQHLRWNQTGRVVGTARYASVNSLSGLELSRRDDLESYMYVILHILMKKLPWQGTKSERKNRKEWFAKVLSMKQAFNPTESMSKFPPEFTVMYQYIKSIRFKDTPNYDYLIS